MELTDLPFNLSLGLEAKFDHDAMGKDLAEWLFQSFFALEPDSEYDLTGFVDVQDEEDKEYDRQLKEILAWTVKYSFSCGRLSLANEKINTLEELRKVQAELIRVEKELNAAKAELNKL